MILSRYRGLTLIELIFAMVLTCFCIAMLLKTYLATHKHQQVIHAINLFQDDARIAIFFLKNAVHSAGDTGCGFLSDKFEAITGENTQLDKSNRIKAYQTQEMKLYSEGFSVTQAGAKKNKLLEDMTQLNLITVSKDYMLSANDKMVINDCIKAEIFTIQDIFIQGNKQILLTSQLHALYKKNTEISLLEFNSYYVAKTDRIKPNGSPLYALYSKDSAGHKQELVANVTSMAIRFSELTDFSLIEKKSTNIKDWAQIRGLAVELTFDAQNSLKSLMIYASISM